MAVKSQKQPSFIISQLSQYTLSYCNFIFESFFFCLYRKQTSPYLFKDSKHTLTQRAATSQIAALEQEYLYLLLFPLGSGSQALPLIRLFIVDVLEMLLFVNCQEFRSCCVDWIGFTDPWTLTSLLLNYFYDDQFKLQWKAVGRNFASRPLFSFYLVTDVEELRVVFWW